MSDTVQLALIAGAPALLLGLVNAILLIRHGWKLKVVGEMAEKTEKNTNSMKDALVAATAAASHAEGMRDERAAVAATALGKEIAR